MESVVRTPSSSEKTAAFLIKWTPRAIAVAIGGYYGLGVAYELGLMALVDKIAIYLIKHFVGYAGVGAIMPTFQWYAAWSVRFALGAAVGLAYDRAEKIAKFFYIQFYPREPVEVKNPL